MLSNQSSTEITGFYQCLRTTLPSRISFLQILMLYLSLIPWNDREKSISFLITYHEHLNQISFSIPGMESSLCSICSRLLLFHCLSVSHLGFSCECSIRFADNNSKVGRSQLARSIQNIFDGKGIFTSSFVLSLYKCSATNKQSRN